LVIRFRDCELDLRGCELRRGGVSVPLTRQGFELLSYLLRHRDRVVSKRELFETLWPDATVTDNALSQTVSMVRRALGDSGRDARFIKTYHGRGYRFVGEVTGEVSDAPPRAVPSAPAPTSGVAPVQARPATSMLGRDAELEQLLRALDDAVGGNGRLVLLEGEAGMGKTRLAQELLDAASDRGVRVLHGRGYDIEGVPALWPWVQMLREYAQACPDRLEAQDPWVLAELARLLPELRERSPELPPLPARTAEEDRFRLFDAVAHFLVRASSREPLLLLIDDLHWADTSSLQCLQLVARTLGDARVLLLAAHRAPRGDEELSSALPVLRQEPVAERCTLAGLGAADVARLVANEGGVLPSERLLSQLSALTQGNPLFVVQVARLLPSQGGSQSLSSIPAGMHDVIRRRLWRLPEACLSLLRAASVFGEEVQLNHLAQAAGLETDRVVELLQPARRTGVLCEDDERLGAYRFNHALFQATLYRDLPPADRAAWHARAGASLERAESTSPWSRLDEIAAHYLEAARSGHARHALDLAERAARRAFESTAYDEAARWYDRALEVLPLCEDVEPDHLPRLWIAKGRALSGLPERADEAQALCRKAFEQAMGQGLDELVCEAALGYVGHDTDRLMSLREAGAVDPVAVQQLETALQRVADDPARRALLLAYLAWTLYDSRDFERREAAIEEAVAVARELDDPETLLSVLRVRARTRSAPEWLDDRLAVTDEVIALAAEHGLREIELDARIHRVHSLFERADVAAVQAEQLAARRLAEQLELPSERERVERLDTMRLFLDGKLEQGLAQAREATERSGQSRNTRQGFGIRLFMVRWLQGRAAEIIPALEAFAQRYPLPMAWRSGLSSCYASAGRLEDARRELGVLAANNLEDLPRDHAYLTILFNTTTAVRLLDDRALALRLLQLGRPYADRTVYFGWWNFPGGAFALGLASHATTAGLADEAVELFEQAMAINGRLDSSLWLTATRIEYGRLLRQLGDVDRGASLLQHGLRDARSLGLSFYVQRAQAPIPGVPEAELRPGRRAQGGGGAA
jgi:DNA-binding winged helix-turn-helix (wHTH) protein/tetratricopeptide (TPR) repeat protein